VSADREAGTVDPSHPYAAARRHGDLVFASGALPNREDGSIVDGREAALEAAMGNLEKRLATAGATLLDIIKLTYFVTDITLRDEANRQCVESFGADLPARSFVEVRQLPYGSSVEIEAIAAVSDRAAP
jgi:enamine deaminase RidA (YjgF/YER057c/UK114 family)